MIAKMCFYLEEQFVTYLTYGVMVSGRGMFTHIRTPSRIFNLYEHLHIWSPSASVSTWAHIPTWEKRKFGDIWWEHHRLPGTSRSRRSLRGRSRYYH